jgi:hypothetical protein
MTGGKFTRVLQRAVRWFLGALSCVAFLALPFAFAHTATPGDASNEKSASSTVSIPPGTILPVRLNPAISSTSAKPGQAITGRIMQDVPLPARMKIQQGSEVTGRVLDVTPATAGAGARISLQFDKLVSLRQTISITTNLRAIAGFMQVIEAQTPKFGAGEGEVFRWLTTVQIGGDVVYGAGGPVVSEDAANQTVGRAVNGGVLSRVRARTGTNCRGAIDGNDAPQALWVFSSDACGAYGLDHVSIEHAGRDDPAGVIVLASEKGDLKIRSGAGMLLRVNASGRD